MAGTRQPDSKKAAFRFGDSDDGDDGDGDGAIITQLKRWHAQASKWRDEADGWAADGKFDAALARWRDAIQLLSGVVADRLATANDTPPPAIAAAAAATATAAAAGVVTSIPSSAAPAATATATAATVAGDTKRGAEHEKWYVACVELCAVLYEQSAQLQLETDRTFAAIQSCEAAIRLRPDWGVAHVTLGRAQLEHGEVALSVETMTHAAALDPDNKSGTDAITELARVQSVLERMHIANANLALAAAAAPGATAVSHDSAAAGAADPHSHAVVLHHPTCSHAKRKSNAPESVPTSGHAPPASTTAASDSAANVKKPKHAAAAAAVPSSAAANSNSKSDAKSTS